MHFFIFGRIYIFLIFIVTFVNYGLQLRQFSASDLINYTHLNYIYHCKVINAKHCTLIQLSFFQVNEYAMTSYAMLTKYNYFPTQRTYAKKINYRIIADNPHLTNLDVANEWDIMRDMVLADRSGSQTNYDCSVRHYVLHYFLYLEK